MSSVSKSIFTLEEKNSELLCDYISLVFTDKKINKNTKTKSFISCCPFFICCKMPYESIVSYANIYNNNDKTDKFTKWIIELSKTYLKRSFINPDKLSVCIIECINSSDEEEKILFENSNVATVIYHFNENKEGYITTHESNLNFLTNDRKYIIVTFN
jgi:hypothetical protein